MALWRCRQQSVSFGNRPLVMGILNTTPDSFSDGGQFNNINMAIAHGERLITEGADILDIGGESTRPGAVAVSASEEIARVAPIIRHFAQNHPVWLSVDTTKHEVAESCLELGAHIINDVSAGTFDPELPAVVRAYHAGYAIMHMQGTPRTMQINPQYQHVTYEIKQYLAQRLDELVLFGINHESLTIDPGIGFGKTTAHNLQIIRELAVFQSLDRPVLLGVSRKRLIGDITGKPVQDRAAGSVAVACYAAMLNTAQIIRVHDVAMTVDALKMVAAISDCPQPVQ